jgi:clan AA aspartic protease
VSGFLSGTPVIRLVIRNPFLGLRYPQAGAAMAVLDTGYDGFVALPGEIFSSLGLGEVSPSEREAVVADGRVVHLRSSPASADLPDLGETLDGAVETAEGMAEVLVGTRLLRSLKVTLDYCAGVASSALCR